MSPPVPAVPVTVEEHAVRAAATPRATRNEAILRRVRFMTDRIARRAPALACRNLARTAGGRPVALTGDDESSPNDDASSRSMARTSQLGQIGSAHVVDAVFGRA